MECMYLEEILAIMCRDKSFRSHKGDSCICFQFVRRRILLSEHADL